MVLGCCQPRTAVFFGSMQPLQAIAEHRCTPTVCQGDHSDTSGRSDQRQKIDHKAVHRLHALLTYGLGYGGFSNLHVGWLYNRLLCDLLIQLAELDQHVV